MSGANGAGKSTTLMTIIGLLPIRRGSLVNERRPIFPDMTVSENLDMEAFQRNDHAGVAADKSWRYKQFLIPVRRHHQPGCTVSGREQQVIALSAT